MQDVNSRYYLYLGRLWHRGWTILDDTDPTERLWAQAELPSGAGEMFPARYPHFFSGRSDSGKYFDGDQTFALKLRQPSMRSSRIMRM